MEKALKRKEIAHNLRVDPRQRFYLRQGECEVIVDIIVDQLKRALGEGRVIDLDTFARIFMEELGPRKLYNYKLRKAIEVKKSYMAKIKLKPLCKHAIKVALREKDNA